MGKKTVSQGEYVLAKWVTVMLGLILVASGIKACCAY